MHISLPLGNGDVLMATDEMESMGPKATAGTNYHLAVETENKEEAQKIFNGLSSGGKVIKTLGDTFWGAYFGMLIDKFGIQWMVSYTYPKNN
jgi:PhnB protein